MVLKRLLISFVLICFVTVGIPTLIVILNPTQSMGGNSSKNNENQQYTTDPPGGKPNNYISGDNLQNPPAVEDQTVNIGHEVDSYKGVPVFFNGPDFTKSYGESYSADGYYFGLKWQCVEFVKRFYYVIKGHKMPNSFGNAKDFFNPNVPQGGLNPDRGLIQYRNGGNIKPQPDDILIFTDGQYGHVGIVTKVTSDLLEIIQQNETKSRAVFPISSANGNYFVGSASTRIPAGWLRKE